MNAEIGKKAAQYNLWEYLFRSFGAHGKCWFYKIQICGTG
jgi:hypothetical protein